MSESEKRATAPKYPKGPPNKKGKGVLLKVGLAQEEWDAIHDNAGETGDRTLIYRVRGQHPPSVARGADGRAPAQSMTRLGAIGDWRDRGVACDCCGTYIAAVEKMKLICLGCGNSIVTIEEEVARLKKIEKARAAREKSDADKKEAEEKKAKAGSASS